MSKGTYSFTTPIYYVNAAPHLGTAYTTIAADTVARYQRMNGYDVAFVTGMDEHGQKVADTAASKGMTPQEWCDSMEPAFRDAWEMLNITYTDFVRTTEPRHAETVKKFWNDLYEKGYCIRAHMKVGIAFMKKPIMQKATLRKTKTAFLCAPIANALSSKLVAKKTGSLNCLNLHNLCSISMKQTPISFVLKRVKMKL